MSTNMTRGTFLKSLAALGLLPGAWRTVEDPPVEVELPTAAQAPPAPSAKGSAYRGAEIYEYTMYVGSDSCDATGFGDPERITISTLYVDAIVTGGPELLKACLESGPGLLILGDGPTYFGDALPTQSRPSTGPDGSLIYTAHLRSTGPWMRTP